MTLTETNNANIAAVTKTAMPRKRETKRNQLVKMLLRKAGVDVATISARLGWQEHSTRAALTGLRKAGFELEATKPDKGGPARYRIVKEATKASA